MLFERAVKIHHLLNRSVKTGDQHIAHNQYGKGIVPVFKPVDQSLLFLSREMMLCQPFRIIVTSRHNERRFRSAEPVKGFLVGHRRIPVYGDNLRLEAVRIDVFSKMFDNVEAYPFDPPGRSGNGLKSCVFILDTLPLFRRVILEDSFKNGIEGLSLHPEIRETTFVKDRHRRPVSNNQLIRVGVYVGSEALNRTSVLFVDRRACMP